MISDPLSRLLERVNMDIRRILHRALDGDEISWSEGLRLCEAAGIDLHCIMLVADEMRHLQAGDVVTYVVNRNINFTNVCIKRCGFCAFSRSSGETDAYHLPIDEIVRLAHEAVEMGATEICLQAGLSPEMGGDIYIEIVRALKKELPMLHLHAFSPEEILYGSRRSGVTVRQYLAELKAAGLGTLPGTSAEILDQDIRDRIAPDRITVRQWIDVVTTAHNLGIRTTATIMYGHIETPLHWVKHMNLLRDIQAETGGFTEFVPLSLIHHEAPMYKQGLVPGVRRGATGAESVKVHAVARLMLGSCIRNIQSSWVKEGPGLAQFLLAAGANDLGGTLMNESISTSAGASHGQLLQPGELRRMIRDVGRTPAERDTNYTLLSVFDDEPDTASPLDMVRKDKEPSISGRRQAASQDLSLTQFPGEERRWTSH